MPRTFCGLALSLKLSLQETKKSGACFSNDQVVYAAKTIQFRKIDLKIKVTNIDNLAEIVSRKFLCKSTCVCTNYRSRSNRFGVHIKITKFQTFTP